VAKGGFDNGWTPVAAGFVAVGGENDGGPGLIGVVVERGFVRTHPSNWILPYNLQSGVHIEPI
jgi:hypothetical protein